MYQIPLSEDSAVKFNKFSTVCYMVLPVPGLTEMYHDYANKQA
jgi:hypothetical protein